MADDRLSRQINSGQSFPKSKLDYWCWKGGNYLFALLCGAMWFMMPYVNALEDQKSMTLSETLSGRWQLVTNSIPGLLIITLITASMSYGFSHMVGIKGGRPLKTNRAFQMALMLYIVQIALGVLGAISFLTGRTPYNGFGF
ncbi:MAG TPA: hypothetical protein VGB77_16560 [Abditibacteriaceae bacterium]|jgi:hypothetical protein